MDKQRNIRMVAGWLRSGLSHLDSEKRLLDDGMTKAAERVQLMRDAQHYNNIQSASLNEVDWMYRNGAISEDVTLAWIEEWNKGPHFTRAVLRDGMIRNYLEKGE